MAVEQLLLAADRDRQFDAAKLNGGALCLGERVTGFFRNDSIRRLGGSARLREGDVRRSSECAVIVHAGKNSPLPSGATYRTERCEFALALKNDEVVQVAVNLRTNSQRDLTNCMYRSILLIEGFDGSLSLPDAKLFSPNEASVFRGEQTVVGEFSPDIFFWFKRLCEYPERPVTRSNLRTIKVCRSA